jgi:hypothetical protein
MMLSCENRDLGLIPGTCGERRLFFMFGITTQFTTQLEKTRQYTDRTALVDLAAASLIYRHFFNVA